MTIFKHKFSYPDFLLLFLCALFMTSCQRTSTANLNVVSKEKINHLKRDMTKKDVFELLGQSNCEQVDFGSGEIADVCEYLEGNNRWQLAFLGQTSLMQACATPSNECVVGTNQPNPK